MEKKFACDNIVLDFNGTIIDDSAYTAEILNEMLRMQGHKTVTVEEYKTYYTVQILKIGFDNKVKTKNDVTPGKLVIKYNRYNPSISYIVGDDLSGNKFFGYIYLICGIVFLISSLLIFVKF